MGGDLMIKFLNRYKMVFLASAFMLLMMNIKPSIGLKAFDTTLFSLKEMILVIPPVFILLGLLDVWVPKDTMIKYMGEHSGLKGILLAFFIGSAAAGPLYGAFPVAAVFMKKGVKFSNILIFIGAWSTTKIPMFIFELTALGPRFAIARLLINIPGILIIALLSSKIIKSSEQKIIYDRAS
jgi:uncharacterized membrane protein YraQ (UPF0718 family)